MFNRPVQAPRRITSRIRLNMRWLPFAVGLTLLLQLFFPSSIWQVLLIFLAGGWIIAYLWAYKLSRSLDFKREIRYGWTQVGDRLQERYTLTNTSAVPALWVEIVDHSTLPDLPPGQVRALGSYASLTWQTEQVCTRRGLYILGQTGLRTGDPLGVYRVEMHDPSQSYLLVMPPVIPLPAIQIAPGGRAGEGSRSRANALEHTVSASGVRPYAPGDNLKLMHWRTTARTGSWFIRTLENTPSSDWWIFLDFNRAVQRGHGWDSTEEHGILLAASLADQGIRAGRAVGLVSTCPDLTWLPPQSGLSRRLEILRALAMAAPGDRPLAELLAHSQASFHRGASLVIITPDLQADWLKPLLHLVNCGAMPTVFTFDPVSFSEINREPASRPATTHLEDLLAKLNIPHYPITRDLLNRPEARPGKRGAWEWRMTGTGKAVAINRPADLAWRQLG
jgi:uncharacterized protein (DUF58 family)